MVMPTRSKPSSRMANDLMSVARVADTSPVYRRRYTAPMPGSVLLVAVVAAVLCPHEVVFVDIAKGAIVRTVELPGDGLAVFAAPDGRVVVPLAGDDSTSVVAVSGKMVHWPGRVFPMFFADFDRMHAALPGMLATLSYPERLLLVQTPLAGVVGVRRGACSADGRLVALVPSGSGERTLLIVAAIEGGTLNRVRLAEEARTVAVAPKGTFAVVASASGEVEVATANQERSLGVIHLGGTANAVVTTPDGRGALVGLARDQGGEVVGVRVELSAKQPLKERFRTSLAGAVIALALTEDEVIAATNGGLVVLSAGGKKIRREIVLAGARDVAILSDRPKSSVPDWSDGTKP